MIKRNPARGPVHAGVLAVRALVRQSDQPLLRGHRFELLPAARRQDLIHAFLPELSVQRTPLTTLGATHQVQFELLSYYYPHSTPVFRTHQTPKMASRATGVLILEVQPYRSYQKIQNP